jgi:hypothetical protein
MSFEIELDPYIYLVDPYNVSPNNGIPIPIILSGGGIPTIDSLSLSFGSGINVTNIQVYRDGILLGQNTSEYGDEVRCNIIVSETAESGFRTIILTNTKTGKTSTLSNVFEIVNAGQTSIDWGVLLNKSLPVNVQSNSNLLQEVDVLVSNGLTGKTTFDLQLPYPSLLASLRIDAKKSGYVSKNYFVLKLETRHKTNNDIVNPPIDGLEYEQPNGIQTEDIAFLLSVSSYDVNTNVSISENVYYNPDNAVINFLLEKNEIYELNLSSTSTTFTGDGGSREFSTNASNQNITWEVTSNQLWLLASVKPITTDGGGSSGGGGGGGGGGEGGGTGGTGGSGGGIVPIEGSVEDFGNQSTETSFSGNREIVVSAASYTNSTNVNRTGIITVTPIGDYFNIPNLQSRKYTVIQSPNVPEVNTITISKTDHLFQNNGGETTFDIITSNPNITWEVFIDGSPSYHYVTYDTSFGSGNKTVKIKADTNTTQTQRVNNIVVRPTGQFSNLETLVLEVIQLEAPPLVTFVLDRYEDGFFVAGGTTKFKVISSNETVTWGLSEVPQQTFPSTNAFTSQKILGGGVGVGSKEVEITVFPHTQTNAPNNPKVTRIRVTPTGQWATLLQPLVFTISQNIDSLPEQPELVGVSFLNEPQPFITSRNVEVYDIDSKIRANQNINSISIEAVKTKVEDPNFRVNLSFTPVTQLAYGDPANLKPDHFTITKILYSPNGVSGNTASIFNISYPLGIRAIPFEYTGNPGIYDYLKNTVTAEIYIHYRNGDKPHENQILTYTLNPIALGEYTIKVDPLIQTIYAYENGEISTTQIAPYKITGLDRNGNPMPYVNSSNELGINKFFIEPTSIKFFAPSGDQINIDYYLDKISDKVGGIYINEDVIPIPVPTTIKAQANVIYTQETGNTNGDTTGKLVNFELNVLKKTDEPITTTTVTPEVFDLTLSKYSETIDYPETSVFFDVIASNQDITWELVSDSGWAFASPNNPIKKGNNTIKVSVGKNTGEDRVALITVTPTGQYNSIGSRTYRLTQIGLVIDPPDPDPDPPIITSTFSLTPIEIPITVLEENSRIISPTSIPVITTTGKQSIKDSETGAITIKNYTYNGNQVSPLLNNQFRIVNVLDVPVDNTKPLSNIFQPLLGTTLPAPLTGTVLIEFVDDNGKFGTTNLNFFIKRIISPKSLIQSVITPITQNVTVNIGNELITPLTDYKLYVEEVHEFGKNKLTYSNSTGNSTYYITSVEIFDSSTNSTTSGLVGIPTTNEEIILFGNLVPNALNVRVNIDFVDRYGNTGNRIIPAYITRDVLPPQLTLVEWPEYINGADYKGFDQEFFVRFISENAFNVKIYVSNVAENRFYNQYSPNDVATFNVQDLVNDFSLPTADGDTFSFDLVLVPIRDTVVGKSETITVTYDASDLQIPRPIILHNFERVIETTFDFDIYKDEVAKYLTHFINFDDREPILISNWERDEITFSEFVEDELGNQIMVKENPTLILKLYEPLPENIQSNTSIWITKQRS